MAANNISQLTAANTFQHWLTATQSLIATANLITNGNGNTFYANTILEVGGTGSSLNVVTSATINDQHSNTINTVSLVVSGNIASANITGPAKVGSTLTVYGDATLDSDLSVVGDSTLGGTLSVTGNNAVSGNLSVANNTTLGKNLTVANNATIGGNVSITGDLNVTGNIVLDSIGFDDLTVAGSGSFGNTLSVTGATTLSTLDATTVNASVNLTVTHNTVTDNLTVGNTATVGGNLGVTGTVTATELLGTANTIIYTRISEAEATALAFSIALG